MVTLMRKNLKRLKLTLGWTNIVGLVVTVFMLFIFIKYPSWPTPDKLLVFLAGLFMIFGKSLAVIKRLLPFVVFLLVYESFRGLVPMLNSHVNYNFMIEADKLIFFGHLPTSSLQNILWNGHISWYDFGFYIVYMLHFVLPMTLALIIWKYRDRFYWRYITSFLLMSFDSFLVYLAFPAAPPWLAAEKGIIEPITRVSSHVWWALGIKDFPSFYNQVAANPVAAMPSLHSAYATLFAIFVFKLFGKKWGLLSLIYPILMYIGTVYQGEHYVIDVLAGIGFAIGAYLITPTFIKFLKQIINFLAKKLKRIALIQRLF